jgi:hypothetical protein
VQHAGQDIQARIVTKRRPVFTVQEVIADVPKPGF